MISKEHNSSKLAKEIVLLLAFIGCINLNYSQHQNVPINFFVSQKIEKSSIQSESKTHTAVKPFNQAFLEKSVYNSVFQDTGKYYYDFTLKLYKENLLNIEEDDVFLVADPLFNLGIGRTTYGDTATNYITNTRGVRVAGNITSKFSFETRYYENQFRYPNYLDSIADARGIAFGLGRAKPFKGNGYDVGMSSGYISYTPQKYLNLQFGQGKHFFGNGYRSMLLSDNAFNYPYLSFALNLWEGKVFYKSINAWIQTLERIPVSTSPEALYKRKGASFRYLSFKPKKQIEIGLFEGVIYKRYQDSIGEVAIDPSFYMPVIGLSSALNSKKDENKVVLGANINITPVNNVTVYGQVVIDDFSKTGFQVGSKWYDLFRLKNSWILVEFNSAAPYLYTQSNENRIQTYSQSNQELAHPLGASFNELIIMAHFEKKRFFATAKYFTAQKKRLGGSIYGENIFLPNDDVILAVAPEKIKWSYMGGEFGYNLNIKTRMQLFGSIFSRMESGNSWKNEEWFWQIGIRTALNNFYYEQ